MIDGNVEVDDLSAGMDARIGTPSACGLDIGAVEMGKYALEFPLHSAQGGLSCPAGEILAVVGDCGAETTQPATSGGGL